jgi:hypothetical protein
MFNFQSPIAIQEWRVSSEKMPGGFGCQQMQSVKITPGGRTTLAAARQRHPLYKVSALLLCWSVL